MDRAEIQSCSPSLSPRVSHPERSRTRFPGLNEGSLKHKQALSEKHLAVHRDAIIRLVGAVLAEQTDEWTKGRRYLSLDVLNRSRNLPNAPSLTS